MLFQSGSFAFGSGLLYTYYLPGNKNLVGNGATHGFQVSMDAYKQSYEFEPSRNRIGAELYFRYEFSKAGAAERTYKDLGFTLKYDFSI